jgi:hypothetical protein
LFAAMPAVIAMTTITFHPATVQLLRLQSRGRRRRIWRRFCQPRRLVLSAVACVLAVVWLGNAAMTVWLREAASAETLRGLLSLGFVLYAAWHLAKAAFFRPESPLEWPPTERDVLAMLPLEPRDLVAYQLASVTLTTSLKTGLFAVLLLPDVRCLPLALVGLLLAMMLLELVRMAVEIAVWGMSRGAYLAYRAAVVVGLVAGGFAVGGVLMREGVHVGQLHVGEGLLPRMLDILLESNASVVGFAALPFQPLVALIVADRFTATMLATAAIASAAMMLFAAGVIGLHGATARRVVQRERRNYHPQASTRHAIECQPGNNLESTTGIGLRPAARMIPTCGGAGPLLWRQMIGAGRSWGNMLTAMIAPAILACAPCFIIADADIALLATTATLAFYTFLLLPTAVRFDFRRDLDRMALLKGLPIKPAAAAIGQTITPVLIATLFQTVVLTFAVAARSLPIHYLVSTMLVMVSVNALVFSLENLIFLLYPYRWQQEGLEIFVRTLLTFTGKGLLFALGLGAISAWGFAAAALTRSVSHWTGVALDAYAVFTAGMIAGPAALTVLALWALCRTYHHLDPIEDIPR